ncbi:TPA: ead/Ea22-like family protein [Escherichia coli]|nr:ead/Ea22-like family protein [Escherichia coli]HBC8770353.1 ead/Ea22-like family protein [Escherichia coli]
MGGTDSQRRQPVRKINYQALRDAAEKATQGEWVAFISPGKYGTYAVHTPGDNHHGDIVDWPGFDEQKNAENNARYIAAFNPEVVQALLDERERNQQYIKSRDQENEEIALTVGKLRVELEGKDSKIANLTAERDALREGEMGDARHSNTRAAADIYFQLVEECEIPAGGSLVEYVDDMREKLEAAEKRIAELEAREIKPAKGEVLVVVSGFTGCGKSAIAGEIEIAMKAIGVPVQWTNGDVEKRMTGADWLTAIEMYKPTVRIVEVNVPRAPGIRIKGE